VRQVAVDDVEIGPANGTCLDAQPDFTGSGQRIGPLHENERHSRSLEHHRLHRASPTNDCAR